MPLSARSGATLAPLSVNEIYDRAGMGGRPKNRWQWDQQQNLSRLPMLGGMPIRTPLPTLGAMPTFGGGMPSYGGGESGGYGGGGTPEFKGIAHQAPFFSDRDGSTVAQVAAHPAYHGLAPFDAQFNDPNHPRPQMTSWGQEWGAASKPAAPAKLPAAELVRGFADGTDGKPIPHGMPFIAGDPQKDKKPNPELIIPGPSGTQVIPLKDLGRMKHEASGTGLKPPMHGLDEFYRNNPCTPDAAHMEAEKLMMHPNIPMPIRVPQSGLAIPKYAYGTSVERSTVPGQEDMLQLLPNPYGTGFSRGALPPAPPAPPTAMAPPPSVPLPSLETPDQRAARLEAMNPQGIDVGFTPRPALHGFADADALRSGGASREERSYARMNREVLREAHGNPRMALALLSGKAQAASDAEKMQFEREKEGNRQTHNAAVEQRRKDAAAGYVSTGQPGQPMLPTVAAQRLRADTTRNAIVDAREAERLGISREELGLRKAADQRAAEKAQMEANPVARVVPVEGSNQGVAMVNGHQATKLPGYDQTAPGFPAMRTPSVNVPWMGQIPSLSFPGAPPQFKPMAKPEPPPKPPTVKNFGDTLKPNWRQFDHTTGAWGPVKFVDKNGNGIPDDMEGGGATPKPSSGFLKAVGG